MSIESLTQGFQFKAVDTATTTGTGFSNPFAVPPSPTGLQRTIIFDCSGTYSICTATLQQSFDGGSTFQSVGAAVDLKANPAGNLATFFAVAGFGPGVIYRLSITTFTGTSITVKLAVS